MVGLGGAFIGGEISAEYPGYVLAGNLDLTGWNRFKLDHVSSILLPSFRDSFPSVCWVHVLVLWLLDVCHLCLWYYFKVVIANICVSYLLGHLILVY